MSKTLAELPARLTTAQAGKLFGPVLSALLREPELHPELAELAIKIHGSAMSREMINVIHKYIEPLKGMNVCSLKVDRTLKLEDAAKQLHRRPDMHFDPSVLSSLPSGDSDIVDLYRFKLDGRTRDGAEIGREYALRGLKSDPLAHITFTIENPEYWYPSGLTTTSVWQDKKGRWCHLSIRDARDEDCIYPCIIADNSDNYCRNYYGGSNHLYFGVRI